MKIIIPIIVGSAIGYLTNWLAIRMLFRPLEEKRIFGFKIPFTPGLIPKERRRIASNIGEAVGKHLLTPEKISEVISGEEAKKKLREYIYIKLDGLKENNSTYLDIVKKTDANNYNELLNSIKAKSSELILAGIRAKSLKHELINFINNDLYDKYNDKVLDKASIALSKMLVDLKQSEELKYLFIKTVKVEVKALEESDKLLKEVFPSERVEMLKVNIDENKETIIKKLRVLFYKPEIQETVKKSLEDLVEENVSKMITMFIEPSTISEKLFIAVSKYIDSAQAEDVASFLVKDSLDNIMDMKVASLVEYFLSIVEEDDISNIYEKATDYFFNEANIDQLVSILMRNIEDNKESIKSSILVFLENSLDHIIYSNNFDLIIQNLVEKSLDKFLQTSISHSLSKTNNEGVESVINYTEKFFNSLLKKELYNIVSLFDVSKIVEDEINSFDIEYTEELILDIAEKELKAITRLGALLGAIMGLLTPLLQML